MRQMQFLDDDNNCLAENCLPESCMDYPYTNKSKRLFSLYSIIGNACICPVVYEILEELKKIYHFKRQITDNYLPFSFTKIVCSHTFSK